MRGSDRRSGGLFPYVDVETRVRSDHPLRAIRSIVNATLEELTPVFDALYVAARVGRRSRRRCCSGRCCCRRSTPSARNGS